MIEKDQDKEIDYNFFLDIMNVIGKHIRPKSDTLAEAIKAAVFYSCAMNGFWWTEKHRTIKDNIYNKKE
jgi:hypothetical protein